MGSSHEIDAAEEDLATAPQLAGREPDALLDTFVFAGNRNLVRDVMVNGQWCVRDGRHREAARIAERYAAALRRIGF